MGPQNADFCPQIWLLKPLKRCILQKIFTSWFMLPNSKKLFLHPDYSRDILTFIAGLLLRWQNHLQKMSQKYKTVSPAGQVLLFLLSLMQVQVITYR